MAFDKDVEDKTESHTNAEPKSFADITASPNAVDVSLGKGGVIKVQLTKPRTTVKPELPETSCTFVVHYEAFLEGSIEPFDSSYSRGKPACWRIEELVPGLALACLNMDVGEKAQFILAPEFFFGSAGCYPRIPANSSALYQIELISIRASDRLSEDSSPEELKAHGNHLFTDNRCSEALKMWHKALSLCEGRGDSADKDLKEVLHLNIACAAMKMGNWEKAKRHSSHALGLNPFSVKGLYRMAVANRHLGDFEQAKECLKKLLRIEPQSSSARAELKILESHLVERDGEHSVDKVASETSGPEIRAMLEGKLDEFLERSQNKVFTLDAELFDAGTLNFLIERAHTKGLKTRTISYDGLRVVHVLK